VKAGLARHGGRDLHRSLTRLGYRVRSQSRNNESFPSALAETADLVVAAGGDGTVAKVLRCMPDRRVPFTILPLGVANNIARSYDIAGSIEELAAGWRDGTSRRLDLFQAGGVWGRKRIVEGLAFGAITKGMMDSHRLKGSREEKLAAARANITAALKRSRPKRWRLELDGKDHSGEFVSLEILNLTHVGPGIRLCGDEGIGDEKLDVLALGAKQRDALVEWLERNDASDPPLRPLTAKTVDLLWRASPLRRDDDFHDAPKRGTRVRIEGVGECVQILVPNAGKVKRSKRRARQQ
jgi:diacylglycerol kinase family enzyme